MNTHIQGQHYAWCPTGMETANANSMYLMHFVNADDYIVLTAERDELLSTLRLIKSDVAHGSRIEQLVSKILSKVSS